MSVLAREASEAPACAARQIASVGDALDEAVQRLRGRPPAFVVTCARGSSDHAATYGKYLIETTLGIPVASVGPSIVSTYGATPKLDGALFLAISQSGRSPDLIELTSAARAGGALVVGVINDTASPLAACCDVVIPQCAGTETAVAATKSFLCSCLALLQLVARWSEVAGSKPDAASTELADAVIAAPDAFAAAAKLDWSGPLAPLSSATNLYVVGRGVGLAAALEIALKLKEVCGLHAEAFSTAELKHGPLALVKPGFPILGLAQHDRTEPSVREAIAELVALGADVASTLEIAGTRLLPSSATPAVLAPLCHVLGAYLALSGLAVARGLDPDRPRNLAKVTRTR